METKTFEEKINKWTKREIAVPPKAQLPEFVNDLTEVVRSRQYPGMMEDVLYAMHTELKSQAGMNSDHSESGNYYWNAKPYENALKTFSDTFGVSSDQLKKIVYDKESQKAQELSKKGHFIGGIC
jgi:hypothetical protein